MATYPCWQHFLALESDFASIARYVEFSERNFSTYSIEFVKLLLATGSELDVLAKILCRNCDPSARRRDINDYRKCLTAHTDIATEEVIIRRYDLTFKPWLEWSSGRNSDWWRSYNDVKHERDTHFAKANLENCMNAIGALFVMVIYCHKAEESSDTLEPYPVLLGREEEPGNLLLESGYRVPDFKGVKGIRADEISESENFS